MGVPQSSPLRTSVTSLFSISLHHLGTSIIQSKQTRQAAPKHLRGATTKAWGWLGLVWMSGPDMMMSIECSPIQILQIFLFDPSGHLLNDDGQAVAGVMDLDPNLDLFGQKLQVPFSKQPSA